MVNLYDETRQALDDIDKEMSDIKYIVCGFQEIKIYDMVTVFDVDYDNGWGGNEIPLSLSIVFEDGTWLERAEYDGSEWWTYKSPPVLEENAEVFSGNLRYDCDN